MIWRVFCHPTSLGKTLILWSPFSSRGVPGLSTGRKGSENSLCDPRVLCSPGGRSCILYPVSPWRTLLHCSDVTVLASTHLAAQLNVADTQASPPSPERQYKGDLPVLGVRPSPGPTGFLNFLSESPQCLLLLFLMTPCLC